MRLFFGSALILLFACDSAWAVERKDLIGAWWADDRRTLTLQSDGLAAFGGDYTDWEWSLDGERLVLRNLQWPSFNHSCPVRVTVDGLTWFGDDQNGDPCGPLTYPRIGPGNNPLVGLWVTPSGEGKMAQLKLNEDGSAEFTLGDQSVALRWSLAGGKFNLGSSGGGERPSILTDACTFGADAESLTIWHCGQQDGPIFWIRWEEGKALPQ